MARGLKFRIKIEEGSHYPCSVNKGAVQLRGYRELISVFIFAYAKSRFTHDAQGIFFLCSSLQTAVGQDHVIVVTTESQVYSWGDGCQGQLGHGDLEPRDKPTIVNSLVGKSIIR